MDAGEVVRRYLRLLEGRDLDGLDELVAEDVVVIAPDGSVAFRDRASWKEAQADETFADMRIGVEQLVSDGEQVAVRYTVTAVHAGEAFGVAPTGRPVVTSGTKIYTVRDGRIQQIAGHDDILGLIRRLGADPLAGA
jgi:predicted ester cyclase